MISRSAVFLALLTCVGISAQGESPAENHPPIPHQRAGIIDGDFPPRQHEDPERPEEISDPKYLLELVAVHQRYGSGKLAGYFLERAEALARSGKDPKDLVQVLVVQATQKCRENKWNEAVDYYLEALKWISDARQRVDYMVVLARCLEKKGDLDGAEATLYQAGKEVSLIANPGDLAQVRQTVNRQLAGIWRAHPDRAASAQARAEGQLRKDPNDFEALITLVQIYTQIRRDNQKAAMVLEDLWTLMPEDSQVVGQFTSTLIQMRQFNKAFEVLQTSMDRVPGSKANYAYQAASVLIQAGLKEEAVAFARKHLPVDPPDESTITQLASILDRAGKPEEAKRVYTELTEGETDTPRKGRFMLQAVQFAIRAGKFDRAEKMLSEVVRMSGQDPAVAQQVNAVGAQLKRSRKAAEARRRRSEEFSSGKSSGADAIEK